jgi:hypothetical protein
MLRLSGTAAAERGALKKVALAVAAVTFAAQLLALAHYHQTQPTERISAPAGIVADNGLCALCIVAFHLPLNPGVLPAIEQPQICKRSGHLPLPRVVYSRVDAAFSIRAPPRA